MKAKDLIVNEDYAVFTGDDSEGYGTTFMERWKYVGKGEYKRWAGDPDPKTGYIFKRVDNRTGEEKVGYSREKKLIPVNFVRYPWETWLVEKENRLNLRDLHRKEWMEAQEAWDERAAELMRLVPGCKPSQNGYSMTLGEEDVDLILAALRRAP